MARSIFNDQIVPGSTVLGFINAHHWALADPIARKHRFVSSTLVNYNKDSVGMPPIKKGLLSMPEQVVLRGGQA